LPQSQYGKIVKYQTQWFADEQEDGKVNDEDKWMIESPLKNKQNKERILKMWTPLVKKFKNNVIRPSPSESATDFKKGFMLKGNDGKIWIIAVSSNGTNRWVHCDEECFNVQTNKDVAKRNSFKKGSKKRLRKGSRKGSKKGSINGSIKKGSRKGSKKRSRK
jgi:hypothetical protein